MADRQHLTIGEVLSLLREEFPDVSISKIRFLESQGLVDPERTPSGYRKFYDHDVDRLRWILRQQRENFLPLKVIRGRLTGEEPEEAASQEASDEPSHVPAHLRTAGLVRPPSQVAAEGSLVAAARAEGVPGTAARVTGARPEEPAGPAGGSAEAQDNAQADGSADSPADGPADGSADAAADQPAEAIGTPPEPLPPEAPPSAEPAGRRPRQGPRGRGGPRRARPVARSEAPEESGPDLYTLDELAKASGCEPRLLKSLQEYGILQAGTVVGGTPYFEPSALGLARIAGRYAELGVEPRHLRAWRNAADREVGLFEQLVMPLLRQRNPQARQEAADRLQELVRLGGDLRAALITEAVKAIK